eukprot:scaffold69698_cov29-Prasinocladus_malaysianus.AAC.1
MHYSGLLIRGSTYPYRYEIISKDPSAYIWQGAASEPGRLRGYNWGIVRPSARVLVLVLHQAKVCRRLPTTAMQVSATQMATWDVLRSDTRWV